MNGISRLDIKQLRVLDALLREKNLSKVAGEMNLTQQAISETLRKLRDLFDDRLFVRQGNSMVPTPLATELGERIRPILHEIDLLLEPSQFDPATYQGVFTISATDYAIEAILPELLKEVRQEAPLLRIIVRDFESDHVSQLLTSGELDLALTFPGFVPKTLPYLKLFDEQHICVASRCSDLLEKHFNLEDIAALPQLVISPSKANLKGSHDDWFASKGLQRNIVMSVPSFKAAPDIIYTTDMIAFYPSRLLPNNKVQTLHTDVKPPTFEVIAAWHPRVTNSPLHQWIIKKLEQLHSA